MLREKLHSQQQALLAARASLTAARHLAAEEAPSENYDPELDEATQEGDGRASEHRGGDS